MNDKGHYVGSVSGGCVEDELVRRFRENELAGPAPARIDFGVDSQEATRMGLPCGGRLEVLVETLTESHTTEDLLKRLDRGELVRRHVDIASGEVRLGAGNARDEFTLNQAEMIKTFGPSWALLLIGDGQLARHVASMARELDYQVTICDPREIFQPPQLVEGIQYSRSMPDDAVRALSSPDRTAIVTLAHDPKQDDLGLSAALESNAFYIGALGSRKSAAARNRRLESLGYSEKQISRIHGPVGLNIGSKRPAEIAISILAQITQVRNGLRDSA